MYIGIQFHRSKELYKIERILTEANQFLTIAVVYSQYFLLHTAVVDCDVLDTIENGYIEYSDGTVYQSVATYNCHIGHELTLPGNAMRTCESNGVWNGTAPTCNSEFCLLYLLF